MKKTILFTFAIMAAMIVTAAPKPELKSQIEAVPKGTRGQRPSSAKLSSNCA